MGTAALTGAGSGRKRGLAEQHNITRPHPAKAGVFPTKPGAVHDQKLL